MLDDIQIMNGR